MNMDNRSKKQPTCLPTAGKCNWCKDKIAQITDGTHVYCSKECKEKFLNNLNELLRDPYNGFR